MSGLHANLVGLALLPFLAGGVFLPHWVLWGGPVFPGGISGVDLMLFSALLFLSLVLHEVLHGIGWITGQSNASWKDITFGFSWKAFAPYAHCTVPLRIEHYRFGSILPCLVLGFFPSAIGLATGNWVVQWFAASMIAAAASDLMMLWVMRTVRPRWWVEDHPTKAGAVATKTL